MPLSLPNRIPARRGFTLVEVMVAMVLSAVLVIGLTGLWDNINRYFLRLTLKQKAVFVLNGEMERLAGLHVFDLNWADYAATPAQLTRNYLRGVTERWIYASGTTIGQAPDPLTTTDVGSGTGTDFEEDPGLVFFWNRAGTDDDRNVVWIDFDRKVTGQLSWTLNDAAADPVTGQASQCWGNGTASDCRLLTVYLEYPFRFNGANAPTDPMEGTSNRDLITVSTIVGRR